MRANHGECEWCRAVGKLSKAETVHHIKEVKSFPELALSMTYKDKDGEHKQLVALCHSCHDKAHGRFCGPKPKKRLNEEKW